MTQIIKRENGQPVLATELKDEIIGIEKTLKTLKARQDEIKKSLLEYMTENDMYKIEADELLVTKIDATDRETFDSKAFREDDPETYNAYVKMSKVSPSIRFTVR